MRYVLIIILLAGSYFGYNYYNTELAPIRRELEERRAEPFPALIEAQKKYDSLTNALTQCKTTLQQAIDDRLIAVRNYQKAHPSTTSPTHPLRPAPRTTEERVTRLLDNYDAASAKVDGLKKALDKTIAQYAAEKTRLEESLRQITTKLDINRIQAAEARNTHSRKFSVDEDRATLLKQQKAIPAALAKLEQQAGKLITQQRTRYEAEQANLEVRKLRIDRRIEQLRNNESTADLDATLEELDIPGADTPDMMATLTPHEERIQTAAKQLRLAQNRVELQIKQINEIQEIRNKALDKEEETNLIEEKIFFSVAAILAIILLLGIFKGFANNRYA